MRKALMTTIGLLIAGILSLYILDVNPVNIIKSKNVNSSSLNVLRLREDVRQPPDQTQIQRSNSSDQEADTDVYTYTLAQGENKQNTDTNNEKEWKMVWSDEFDEETINLDYWTLVYRIKNFNNELQCYLPGNSEIDNGSLRLTANKDNAGGKKYSSAMLETLNKLTLRYGKIEARMKLPEGQGLFPAFWLLSEQEEEEVDIMEMIGNDPDTIYGVNHYNKNEKRVYGTAVNKTSQDYHVYSLDWEPDGMTWYIDGNRFLQTTEGIPSVDMYIIFTLAVGGDWPGPPDDSTVFPSSMMVDYIRIYRHI
jgi:beta-glucanase (GH16 family)